MPPYRITAFCSYPSLRHRRAGLLVVLSLFAAAFSYSAAPENLVQRQWFEARTAHFQTYSCGPTQQVAKLAARLEQFRAAYAVLAGAQAVASPPIAVMAFPDHASLRPFLPLYDGKPANLAALFSRGSDENLIAVSLSDAVSDDHALEAVYHEYTHLLLRHNDPFWPMWLAEGMADIYGTFEVTGGTTVRIGKPMPTYVRLLQQTSLMPLTRLLAVNRESPDYNARGRQGLFYAQSWLLTHYLMLGDNPRLKGRFGQLTTLLRLGHPPEAAFTNAFQIPLARMDQELQAYLRRGKFESLSLRVNTALNAPQALRLRLLTPAETAFHLGDQLLRLGRDDAAREYFAIARSLAPASPLGFEGLGLLAAETGNHTKAIDLLDEAIKRGSTSYLAYYVCARERLRLLSAAGKNFAQLSTGTGIEVRQQLEKSLALMADFGPAHHLLGVLLLAQGDQTALTVAHLQRAVQLEPENLGYLLSLAQAQLLKNDRVEARRNLEVLQRPYVSARLRSEATKLLEELGSK